MANENSARDRSNDPLGRGAGRVAPTNDPLAELARLIGRNDALSQSGREPRPAPQTDALDNVDPAPEFDREPAPSYAADDPPYHPRPASEIPQSHQDWPGSPPSAAPYSRNDPVPPPYSPPPYSPSSPPYAPPVTPHDDNAGYASPRFPSSSFPAPPSFPVPPSFQAPPNFSPPPSFPAPSSFQPPSFSSSGLPDFANSERPSSSFSGSSYPSASRADPLDRAGTASEQTDPVGFETPVYEAAADRPGHEPLFPHDPEAGGMPAPHDDDFYDDEPGGGRRKGLLTVVAVLGLAVLGTAGAFGYRTFHGGARSAAPPPVIRASGEPSKVAPPPAAPDPSASKFSYDRFGDAGKDEKVVKREEQPVDLSKVAPPPPTPPPAPAQTPASSSTAIATTPAANPPSAIGEPRRVRTVPIRPDQGGDAVSAPPSQQPSSVAPRQANASATAAPRASSRVAMRPTPEAPPARAANAPLSLSPDANNEPAAAEVVPPPQPVPQPVPRPAPSAASPRPAASPARVAAVPAQASVAGGGSFLVQVSSQKSQAEAESAYRGIQSKYAGVLAGQPHQVRRADLGAKGVYYRAMIGPFGTREAAVQLCVSLKQAGGDCVVQR